MADFLTAWNYMMDNEDSTRSGEVAEDSDGGTVRLGLDSKSNPELLTNRFYTVPVAEALVMSQPVYQQKYWKPIWGEQILSQRVASKFLDMAVNENPPEAIRLVQRAAYGLASGPKIDGVMGVNTLTMINNDTESGLLQSMCVWMNWLDLQAIRNNPSLQKYADGWRVRAYKVPGV